jgi:hypothetical protein
VVFGLRGEVAAALAVLAACGSRDAPAPNPPPVAPPSTAAAVVRDAVVADAPPDYRGAVTLNRWRAANHKFVANVTTTVPGTFAVMAGACEPRGIVLEREVRTEYEPPSKLLAAGVATDIELALAPGESDLEKSERARLKSPTIAGYYFEIDAMTTDGAALAQQIYASGGCASRLRRTSHSAHEGPRYLRLPSPTP